MEDRAPSSTPLDSVPPGSVVGPYRIVRRLHQGRGGMARIFVAEVREKYRQPGTPKLLALKVARPDHQSALVAEADFLSRFSHPNVVRIFPIPGKNRPVYAAREQFPFGWGWYYAMELLEGGSLQRRLCRPTTMGNLFRTPTGETPLSLLEVLGLSRQLLAALAHIHECSVVNLDVKPGNVLFRRRSLKFLRSSVPLAVLADFGISRDLRYPRAGLLGVATPEYVSPEHALELSRDYQGVDPRSDIFSLGVVMYEMLVGQLPFADVGQLIDPTFVPIPPREFRPTIPAKLEAIVLRALKKDPRERFSSAAEMLTALAQVPRPPDWGALGRRTAAGLALASALVGGSWGVARLFSPEPPRPTAPPAVVAPTETLAPTFTPTASPTSRATPTTRPTATLQPTFTPRPTATPTPPVTPTSTPGG